jgi:hypothetical protein
MRKQFLMIAALAPMMLAAQASAAGHGTPEELAPIALNSLPAPPRGIQAAQVFNQSGQMIGGVERVAVDASGKPSALSIRPRGGKDVVVISAAAASYDAPRNIIVAALPDDRLASR